MYRSLSPQSAAFRLRGHERVTLVAARDLADEAAVAAVYDRIDPLMACTLALPPFRDTLIEGFSHFVTSMTAPIASGRSDVPGGPCTHWKAPPFHGARHKQAFGSGSVSAKTCEALRGSAMLLIGTSLIKLFAAGVTAPLRCWLQVLAGSMSVCSPGACVTILPNAGPTNMVS
jgi:hypothetical protein